MKRHLPILLLAVLLTVASCTMAPTPQIPDALPGATLHLYLQPMPQEAQRLSLTISALDAVSVEGHALPLLHKPLQLNPGQHLTRQTKLLTAKLPPGEYQGLKITISSATSLGEDGKTALLTEITPQLITEKFLIRQQSDQTLFLSLQPERLISAGYHLNAHFSLHKPQPPLVKLKGLVSHPTTGTLTLFEKKTPAVIAILAAGRRPTGLVLDQRMRKAYLALAGEDSIAAIDLSQGQIQRKVRLHSADRPEELVLSADGQTLIAANPGSNSISILDTPSLIERERIQFSTRPGPVFLDATGRLAFVILPEANGLAAIDLDRATLRTTATLAESPIQGIADNAGKQLYLLAADSPNLLVVDADNLTIDRSIFVGFGAKCLALNKNTGLIYIGLKNGEIAIVDPQLGLPLDSFRTGGEVVAMVPDLEENSLFVLLGKSARLEKYDLVSKKRIAVVELDAVGYAAVVMGER
ncbi:YncE family protein [Pelobacter seleniigenes]|uniref:YncE family protein n=1 Tax=Pelobacter seleniigenes TaxID=407188 RepID=UPI0004A6FB9A|nr:YncE family protein [Pelobacter seleniigenes]